MNNGTILNNTYQIIKPIGSGGVGIIYLGYHLNLQKHVVIKKVKDHCSGLMNNRIEVDILKSLHHTYLPQVYDFLEIDDGIFTVMDYISGHDLMYYLESGYQFPEEQIVLWMKQLCEVLAYLRSRKPPIIHCDIKPGNIMITDEGNICLIDFNISLDGENNKDLVGLSGLYASPEQVKKAEYKMRYGSGDKVKIDQRTDIFSLGAVFYYIMTGIKPNVREQEVISLRYMDHLYNDELANIVDKAMETDPAKRFKSAEKMLDALEHMEKWNTECIRRMRRGAIVGGVTGCLALVLLCAGILGYREKKKEDRYYEQIQAAKRYLNEADYEKMISAYEMAIELKPEDPDAYIGLVEYYLEEGEYYEAKSIARTGLIKTNNKRLQDLIILIDDTRAEQFQQTGEVVAVDTEEKVNQENMDSVLVRNDVIGMVAEYCYQQYANAYKQVDVKYISGEQGCQVRFKGLELYAYFKNDASHSNMVDSYNKRPTKTAKPYKVEITKPSVLFVGYDGYITSERIGEMFNIEPGNALEQEGDSYFLVFDYLGCTVKIETDQKGNVCDKDALIELYPLNLDSDWEEEEQEEEEEIDDGTFVLAGETYTYDVESIYIYNAILNNIEPLYECKKLKSVMFINCTIADLSPLAGCTALQEFNLQDSTGNLDLSCLSGLSSLKYLGFHECRDIDDLSPIMNLDLYLLHPCGSEVPYEQVEEYMNRHPGCEVWFDYYCIS